MRPSINPQRTGAHSAALPGHAPEQPDAVSMALQIIDGGAVTEAARRWLQAGLHQWQRRGGTLPLERCLGLPPIKAQRKAQRDAWLIKAAAEIQGKSNRERCIALAAELVAFVTRGPWRFWKVSGAPSATATELQRCLFNVAMNDDGATPLGDKQISRIVFGTSQGVAMSHANSDTARMDRKVFHAQPNA